jgi:hypothetical protein
VIRVDSAAEIPILESKTQFSGKRKRTGARLNGIIVAVPVMVVEMQYEHSPMGLIQDVDDRAMVCISERNRWRSMQKGASFNLEALKQELEKKLESRAPSNGFLALVVRQLRLATHHHTLGLGALTAFGGAGADKLALKLGQTAEHGEHGGEHPFFLSL